MWRNTDVLAFLGQVRAWNETVARQEDRTGFYGLDIYDMRDFVSVDRTTAVTTMAQAPAPDTYPFGL